MGVGSNTKDSKLVHS